MLKVVNMKIVNLDYSALFQFVNEPGNGPVNEPGNGPVGINSAMT